MMTDPDPNLGDALSGLLNNLAGAPTWLVAKVDQRVAHIEAEAGEGIDAFAKQGAQPLVVTPLTEPAELNVSMDEWEHTCDNCRAYCPPPQKFLTGNTARRLKHGQYLVITFGACPSCQRLP